MPQSEIDILTNHLSKLPGIGKRSAKRILLHLIKNKETLMNPLGESIKRTAATIKECENCGNIDDISPCKICKDIKRDQTRICVVEEVSDLWAIERSNMFKGLYHVLGGTLSAIDGVGPEDLNIVNLSLKAANNNVKELIMATNATVDGQTTAHYIAEIMSDYNVTISRIAHGIPIGGELDYLDDGTLNAAFNARKPL